MPRRSELDASTAGRCQRLGEIGELLAEKLLIAAGFVNVRNLNRDAANYPFADFYAERGCNRYAVSVKMRNKYETGTGRLNSRYKLGAKCYELAARAEEALNAQAAWLAIALDAEVLSAYFGLLKELAGSRGISMTPSALRRYECLVENYEHGLDYAALKNVYRLVGRRRGGRLALRRPEPARS